MPIMQGRLRGTKWIVGAGEHGYWLGSYEMNKRLAFEREIAPGTVMYDIGANVGYFSLLAGGTCWDRKDRSMPLSRCPEMLNSSKNI